MIAWIACWLAGRMTTLHRLPSAMVVKILSHASNHPLMLKYAAHLVKCGLLLLQGGGKQAGSKQSQAGGSADRSQAGPSSAIAATGQSQAPAPPQPAAGSKAKPVKQGSKVQQQQQQQHQQQPHRAAADRPAVSLPSDVFAHLPKYKVHSCIMLAVASCILNALHYELEFVMKASLLCLHTTTVIR